MAINPYFLFFLIRNLVSQINVNMTWHCPVKERLFNVLCSLDEGFRKCLFVIRNVGNLFANCLAQVLATYPSEINRPAVPLQIVVTVCPA